MVGFCCPDTLFLIVVWQSFAVNSLPTSNTRGSETPSVVALDGAAWSTARRRRRRTAAARARRERGAPGRAGSAPTEALASSHTRGDHHARAGHAARPPSRASPETAATARTHSAAELRPAVALREEIVHKEEFARDAGGGKTTNFSNELFLVAIVAFGGAIVSYLAYGVLKEQSVKDSVGDKAVIEELEGLQHELEDLHGQHQDLVQKYRELEKQNQDLAETHARERDELQEQLAMAEREREAAVDGAAAERVATLQRHKELRDELESLQARAETSELAREADLGRPESEADERQAAEERVVKLEREVEEIWAQNLTEHTGHDHPTPYPHKGKKICPCGNTLMPDAEFCRRCGLPIFHVGDRVRLKEAGDAGHVQSEGTVVHVDEDGDPDVRWDSDEEPTAIYASELRRVKPTEANLIEARRHVQDSSRQNSSRPSRQLSEGEPTQAGFEGPTQA